MEGISHEAASLAGHLKLGRLMAFYDDNHITIDGPTELTYNDNVEERFEAYGWNVRNLGEMANDVDGLEAAIREALEAPSDGPDAKPTLLVLRSHIGWPSPKLTDTAAAHGSPFGADEIRVTKKLLGLPPDETFWVPDEVRAFYGRRWPGAGRYARNGKSASPHGTATGWPGRRRRPAGVSRDGTTNCRRSRPAPSWPPATPSTSASTPPRTACPAWWPGRPTYGNNGVAGQGRRHPSGGDPRRRAAALRHP